MPRTARHLTPGVVYHVITRFVDRSWFFRDTEERELYLRLLGRSISRSDWRCLAYALMSNHIHLKLLAGYSSFASLTKPIHSPFARWMNHRHGRLGPLLADRPATHAFLPHNEAGLIAYIHNNPVRAGVVKRPSDSDWTSHRVYAGLVTPPAWLDVELGMKRAGFEDPRAFDAWVRATPGERQDPELAQLRKASRALGALSIGTAVADDGATLAPLFVSRGGHVRLQARQVVEIVADVVSIPISILCSRRRIANAVSARAVAVTAAFAAGITQQRIADALGISSAGVHKLAHRVLTDTARRQLAIVLERLELAHFAARKAG